MWRIIECDLQSIHIVFNEKKQVEQVVWLCACPLIVQYAQYSHLPLSGSISIKLLPEASRESGDFKQLILHLITCQETELTLNAHS